MKSLSSLSKAELALGSGAALLVLSAALSWFDHSVLASESMIAGLAAVLVAWVMIKKAQRSIAKASAVSRAIAAGDFEARVTAIDEQGDLGDMLWAINRMIDRCDAYVRESAAAMQAVRENKYYRKIREEGLNGALLTSAKAINSAMEAIKIRIGAFNSDTRKFEETIGAIVESVTKASAKMGETASTLSSGAGTTLTRTNTVASITDQATMNMQTISAACTELSSSAKEVGQQVAASSELTREAVERTTQASHTIEQLSRASESIGMFAELISGIAAQTNLLALNATIEAARAGDAGKGFAVVAQEVKVLAAETAKATSQISQHISEVQTSTRAAVEAISDVDRIIGRVKETAHQVAETVMSQASATDEIANNVGHAFSGFREITVNIHGVTENVANTESLARTTSGASLDLSAEARRLASEVKGFIVTLQKGPEGSDANAHARGEYMKTA